MVIVLFRNELKPGIDMGAYEQAFADMFSLASEMPGFVSIEGYSAPDGAELAVVKFDSEETLETWRNHPEHLKVQARAREEFYDAYQITVTTPIREYSFGSGQ